jgi:hypothetical protein
MSPTVLSHCRCVLYPTHTHAFQGAIDKNNNVVGTIVVTPWQFAFAVYKVRI